MVSLYVNDTITSKWDCEYIVKVLEIQILFNIWQMLETISKLKDERFNKSSSGTYSAQSIILMYIVPSKWNTMHYVKKYKNKIAFWKWNHETFDTR